MDLVDDMAGSPLLYRHFADHSNDNDANDEHEDGIDRKRLKLDPAYRRSQFIAQYKDYPNAVAYVFDDWESLLCHLGEKGKLVHGTVKTSADNIADVHAIWFANVVSL